MKKLGIIGGGQLARMLALAAAPLGTEVHILSDNNNDPAAQVVNFWQKGNSDSVLSLKKFLQKIDFLTFESEFANIPNIKTAFNSIAKRPYTFPSLNIMNKIQDRFSQKTLLESHNIKSSPFIKISNSTDLNAALKLFNNHLVLKKRKFGYDGFGTFIVNKNTPLKKIITLINNTPEGFIAEKFIPFDREIAFTIIRSKNGTLTTLPFVESFQKNSQCFWVKGPLKASKHYKVMQQEISDMINSIKFVGTLAIELFEFKDQLLVNELAPRVHNSAHYSQNALNEDQFTLHLKSGLNLPFQPVHLNSKGFAMLNLLGSRTSKITTAPISTSGSLHWYGKNSSRPGRKMGHINYLDDSPENALKLALKEQKIITL